MGKKNAASAICLSFLAENDGNASFGVFVAASERRDIDNTSEKQYDTVRQKH